MRKEQLLRFCKEHEIWVPNDAKVEQIHAAIARAAMNKTKPKVKNCFGFWEHENSTCSLCDFEEHCFKASHGIEKSVYFKKFESAPKVRFTDRRLKK